MTYTIISFTWAIVFTRRPAVILTVRVVTSSSHWNHCVKIECINQYVVVDCMSQNEWWLKGVFCNKLFYWYFSYNIYLYFFLIFITLHIPLFTRRIVGGNYMSLYLNHKSSYIYSTEQAVYKFLIEYENKKWIGTNVTQFLTVTLNNGYLAGANLATHKSQNWQKLQILTNI